MKLSLFELLYGLSEALDHVESEWHPLPKVHAKKTAYFAVRMGECAGLKKRSFTSWLWQGFFMTAELRAPRAVSAGKKRGRRKN